MIAFKQLTRYNERINSEIFYAGYRYISTELLPLNS